MERQLCVPDGPAIREALDEALNRAEVVFSTGGLGPTSDDISRESAAELLDLRLQLDEHVLKIISIAFLEENLFLPIIIAAKRWYLRSFLPNDFWNSSGLYFSPTSSRRARHLFLPGPPASFNPCSIISSCLSCVKLSRRL